MKRLFASRRNERRHGAVTVETAMVLPVYFLVVVGLIELSRAFMVGQLVSAAARDGCRMGAMDGFSSADVEQAIINQLEVGAIPTSAVSVTIYDGSVYDDPSTDPDDPPDVENLPEAELSDGESRQLYIVRVVVPYDQVSFFTPWWLQDVDLVGQMVIRHE